MHRHPGDGVSITMLGRAVESAVGTGGTGRNACPAGVAGSIPPAHRRGTRILAREGRRARPYPRMRTGESLRPAQARRWDGM